MSNSALASARRRRAGPEPVTSSPLIGNNRQTYPQPSFPGQPSTASASASSYPPSGGLTIQQVVAVVDKRLTVLEASMKDQKEVTAQLQQKVASGDSAPVAAGPSQEVTEILDEYSARFDIIADELASLKDMLLKLQSFTMEVNKMLMDERVRMLTMTDDLSGTGEQRNIVDLDMDSSTMFAAAN